MPGTMGEIPSGPRLDCRGGDFFPKNPIFASVAGWLADHGAFFELHTALTLNQSARRRLE